MTKLFSIFRILIILAGLFIMLPIFIIAVIVLLTAIGAIIVFWFLLGMATMLWWHVPLNLWQYAVTLDKHYLSIILSDVEFWICPWNENDRSSIVSNFRIIKDIWKQAMSGLSDAWSKLVGKTK